MKRLLALPMAIAALVGMAPQAMAHMVETFFDFNPEGLEFQSKFSSGEPVENADVLIYAPNNPDEPWARMTTDEEGRFSFAPDASIPGEWEVKIEQGIGHEDLWMVPVSEQGLIEYENISQADDVPVIQIADSGNPLIVAGAIGLGTCMAIAAYASRKEE